MSTITSPNDVSEQVVASYRRNGFVHIPNIITKQEAERFRQAALAFTERRQSHHKTGIFDQFVNVWRDDDEMKALTLHPNVAAVAERLAGVSLRLWHDQILIKQPKNNRATEFHQDQPYWPHENAPNPISAWIALVDVPVERGCMTFIPESQSRTDLPTHSLQDATSLFALAPDLAWEQRITIPLKAGDCTFHHGRCAHMATPNLTDEPRVAHVVIFTDAQTRYTGKPHVVTDPLSLREGGPLEGELFPLVRDIAS